MVVICTSADDCSDYTHCTGEEENGSFTEFTRDSTDERAGGADDKKLITSELCHSGDGYAQFD
jgi:hypothetical protein